MAEQSADLGSAATSRFFRRRVQQEGIVEAVLIPMRGTAPANSFSGTPTFLSLSSSFATPGGSSDHGSAPSRFARHREALGVNLPRQVIDAQLLARNGADAGSRRG